MSSNEITTTSTSAIAANVSEWELHVDQIADQAARQSVFEENLRDKAENTLRAYRTNLDTFCQYLADAKVARTVESLAADPDQWAFLTYGIVKGFREWLLRRGYSRSTVQHKLSTVKLFAKLATEAGTISHMVGEQISTVKGPPTGKRGMKLDERREAAGIDTRTSTKEPETLLLTVEKARALRNSHLDYQLSLTME